MNCDNTMLTNGNSYKSALSLSAFGEEYFKSSLTLAFLSDLFIFSEYKNTVVRKLLSGSLHFVLVGGVLSKWTLVSF